MSDHTLTIVIPAFNEEASLPSVLPGILDRCALEGWKLIVVDDGSTDGTAAVLARFTGQPNFRIIRHKLNRGYGGAMKSGIAAVDNDFVATIDADGQHDLEDVGRLFAELLEQDADMVVGSRKGLPSASWYRGLGKRLIRMLAKFLLEFTIHDINSGMKIYDAALGKRFAGLCPDSMAFSDVITLVFVSERLRVCEKPIRVRDRMAGRSTITTLTAFETVMEIVNIVVLFNPHRIFLPVAFLSVFLGVTWGLPIVLRGDGVSVGAMLAILTGIIFFFLGLLAEQISLIRRSIRS